MQEAASNGVTPEYRRSYRTQPTSWQERYEGHHTIEQTLHQRVGIRDRLHHFTWAWFTATMSTGAIALVLSVTPHRFRGLVALGDAVMILDLILFLIFLTCITTRFIIFPKSFIKSLRHPTESLFFPSFWISVVNILNCIQEYGAPKTGPWLVTAMRVLFWMYSACAFMVAVGQNFLLYTGKPLTLQSFTPAAILPVFPIMLSGTMASIVGPSQPPHHALPILVAGITFQGLGILTSSYMFSIYISRLMVHGLPPPATRPGMFIAVGPPSFTALAVLGISDGLTKIYPSYATISGISNPDIVADMFRIVAVCTAVFMWATAFWMFSVALVSVLDGALTKKGMGFHMVWWASVFPNVGFAIATIQIGHVFESEGILWVGSAMTIALVAVWLFVCAAHIKAVWDRRILWPGKDEDRDQ